MLRTQEKKHTVRIHWASFKREGDNGEAGLGGVNNGCCLTALNAKVRVQPREYIIIAMRYVSVIIYKRGNYMNLQSVATVVTSFHTCFVPSERKQRNIKHPKVVQNMYGSS